MVMELNWSTVNSETWEKEIEVTKKEYQPKREKQINSDTI